MIQTLFIDRWHPATLNEIHSGHWAIRSRRKAADREMVGAYWLKIQGVKATGKRKVSLHLVYPAGRRRADPDAFFKSLLDSLVACGALVNDSPTWVQLGSVTYSRSEDADGWGTFVSLEDV